MNSIDRAREMVLRQIRAGDYSCMVVGLFESGTRELISDVSRALSDDGYPVISIGCVQEGSDEDFVANFFRKVDEAAKANTSSGNPVVVVVKNFDVVAHLTVECLKNFTCGLVVRHDEGKMRLVMESKFSCTALMRRAREHIKGRTTFEHAVTDVYVPLDVNGERFRRNRSKCIASMIDVLKKYIVDADDQREYGGESLFDILCLHKMECRRLREPIIECLKGYGVINNEVKIVTPLQSCFVCDESPCAGKVGGSYAVDRTTSADSSVRLEKLVHRSF